VGEQHPLTHYSIFGLCRIERALGRPQVAVELCREALSRFEASPPPPGWQSRVGYYLAQALWNTGAEQEALDVARRARALTEDPQIVRDIEAWLADPAGFSTKPAVVTDPPPR
jgi:hypothetical protein